MPVADPGLRRDDVCRCVWLPSGWFNGAPAASNLHGIGDANCDPAFAAFHLAVKKGLLVLGWDASEKFAQDYACLYGVNESFAAVRQGGELVPIIPNNIVVWQMAQTVASAVLIFLFLLALRNTFKIK